MSTRNFGIIGRSQLLSSGGIGGIYELRTSGRGGQSLESVMVSGLDHWSDVDLPVIREPQLEKNLKKKSFRGAPHVPKDGRGRDLTYLRANDAFVPAYRFPLWLVCNKCERLGKEEHLEFESIRGGAPRCLATIKGRDCRGRGIPARLVMSCFSETDSENGHPGHIEDFPWIWWAHRGKECDHPVLYLRSTGESSGLSGLHVKCRTCNKGRTLRGVFNAEAFYGYTSGCSGFRPWLADHDATICARPVRAVLRGASNVYFPMTASALSIPPYSEELFQMVARLSILSESFGSVPTDTLVQMAKNFRGELNRYSDREIADAIEKSASSANEVAPMSENEQRAAEHKAIVQGRAKDSDFSVELIDEYGNATRLQSVCNALVKAFALREVRVLRGFNRLMPPNNKDSYNAPCAPISGEDSDWLPAIEVRGEGIYMELDPIRILDWQSTPEVKKRHALIANSVEKRFHDQGIPFDRHKDVPAPGYILIHTLAHMLINQLTLDCGYSTASLRERLYIAEVGSSEPFFGILIYTATASSDGTLGGLVRQGDPDRMEASLIAALTSGSWCASDPLCMESMGQGPNVTNLAACHACCIVSETSCEIQNTFLDRGLVIGTHEVPEVGFFTGSSLIDVDDETPVSSSKPN
jgi:hypothetical protein